MPSFRPRSRSSTTTPSCPATRKRSRASPATPASCCAATSPRWQTPSRRRPTWSRPAILRAFGTGKGEIVVLNDEAHHCYQDKLLEHPDDEADKEDKERNRDARVWFRGLLDLRRKAGIKVVYDLSATPYYLKGSGYNEGFIFPWVVSDFSLMDAIESGIVKIPRIPVDDDAAGKELVYLQLVGQHPAAAAQTASSQGH